jgi:pimeloyl-ACP methyl ester carboxylesterase
MKFVARILLIFFAVSWPVSASAGALADYMEARKIYVAAAACMASYGNRSGSIAVAAFEQEGWKVEPFKLVGDKAEARYLLAWNNASTSDNRDIYLLAVAGTENVRDVKVDLRTKKVYFAGSTLEEFAANAARTDMPPDAPRVHEGFNQATQVLLNAGSVQSNDAQAGTLRRLSNILKEDPDDKLLLVGHSLGGAVVTLAAARLLDMGVNPKRIEVITFGAPTIGNEAFVQKYDGKFALTRVVVPDDIVPLALRKIFGGYRHIGSPVVWQVPGSLQNYFSHDVPLYLDLATKNFYLKRRAAINEGILPRSEPIPGKNRLYVAAIRNNMPPALMGEFSFMQEALWEEYDRILPGYVADLAENKTLSDLEKAKAAGCTLLVVPEIRALWVRDEGSYYVSLNQTVYRVSDGTVLNVGIFGSSTKVLTPMGALIHGARTMNVDSSSWAEAK